MDFTLFSHGGAFLFFFYFLYSMFPFMMIAIIINIDKITFRIRFALGFFVCVLWRFSLKIQGFLFYIIFLSLIFFFCLFFLNIFSFFFALFNFDFLLFGVFWFFKKKILFSAANFWYSILVCPTIWSYWFKLFSFLISSCLHRDKIFLYTVYEFFDLFIQIVVMFWFWNLQ